MEPDRREDPAGMGEVSVMRDIPLAAIRARAYDIWERNHRPAGFEIQFWLLAERELRAEMENRRDAEALEPRMMQGQTASAEVDFVQAKSGQSQMAQASGGGRTETVEG